MNVLVLGAEYSVGTSSKTGEPYSFGVVYVASPLKSVKRENRVVTACGYKVAEIKLAAGVIPAMALLEYPLEVELTIEHELFGDELKPVCVGVVS